MVFSAENKKQNTEKHNSINLEENKNQLQA